MIFEDFPDAECVDEFFLFPYEVLDADFDTVCLDLARFSADMEQLLARQSQDETASSFLKAAKASDQLKTLWIYRGKVDTKLSGQLSCAAADQQNNENEMEDKI